MDSAQNDGVLSDVDVLRLGLTGDSGLKEAFEYYTQHVLQRYGKPRFYEDGSEAQRRGMKNFKESLSILQRLEEALITGEAHLGSLLDLDLSSCSGSRTLAPEPPGKEVRVDEVKHLGKAGVLAVSGTDMEGGGGAPANIWARYHDSELQQLQVLSRTAAPRQEDKVSRSVWIVVTPKKLSGTSLEIHRLGYNGSKNSLQYDGCALTLGASEPLAGKVFCWDSQKPRTLEDIVLNLEKEMSAELAVRQEYDMGWHSQLRGKGSSWQEIQASLQMEKIQRKMRSKTEEGQ